MTDLDRIAALSTIAARIEMTRERLAGLRIPLAVFEELGAIQGAIEALIASYDTGAGEASEDR